MKTRRSPRNQERSLAGTWSPGDSYGTNASPRSSPRLLGLRQLSQRWTLSWALYAFRDQGFRRD